MSNHFPVITIPFEERHKCWFCGEPYSDFADLPLDNAEVDTFNHSPCQIPACKECYSIVKKQKLNSAFAYRTRVKQVLTKKYAKHLQIGERWSEQELQESELDGAAFLGFKKSAWLMHTIAKQRVSYLGWPIEINGVLIDEEVNLAAFNFDGMEFCNINAAVNYYAEAYHLDEQLLHDVVRLLPREQFSFAIRLCRLYPIVPAANYSRILDEIKVRIAEHS